MPRKPTERRPAARTATKHTKRGAGPAPFKGGLPSREEILDFVQSAQSKVGKREIARAFSIKGSDRIALKQLLAEMADEGLLTGGKKELKKRGGLPPVAVLEVKGRDDDGDLIAEPVVWDEAEGKRPEVLLLVAHRKGHQQDAEIGIGDRVLSRITELDGRDIEGFRFEAEPIRRLPRDQRRLVGIFRSAKRGGGTIEPIDRKSLRSWAISAHDQGTAKDGDLVRFELMKRGRFATPQARILETLGNPDDQRQISLIAIHAHGIPDDFPESVIAETVNLKSPTLQGREDLRDVPLLTIDPADARDHDDAVHAEPDTDEKNPGGFIVLVAIADVAHYVQPASRLDREARLRGNSVYFPDRVVPMLPEKISNDLCSLREGEDRPCLVARMVFDAHGEKRRHSFHRAMMRSAAKLSYQEAQAAFDGTPGEKAAPLMDAALKPLWAAYQALARARDKRGPLDLDLPEKKIRLDAEGRVADVVIPERLDAHRLIEEFMIQANVAAAEALEAKKKPVVYRAHAEPSKEKLKSLREFLETLDLALPPQGQLKPAAFNRILDKAKALPVPELVNEVVLRSQAQAEYTIDNYGHFGLNLRRYAHFTSPIRRYADLIVHRALISGLELGDGGLAESDTERLAETARLISEAERRAMAAERETVDRLIASHLSDRIGATFRGRIAGVTRSGLFVRLAETGADGFVPISSLENDFYHHIEEAHALLGARSNAAYRLGDSVEVRLVEAIPTAGALRFEMITPPQKGVLGPVKGGRRLNQRRGRPPPGRGGGRRR
ncbi:MAG: ribonuclease R [Hyphomicrobiaceae bacterium]|nr:ribonuclease R [Hyphomicrobiaceae bacterium]